MNFKLKTLLILLSISILLIYLQSNALTVKESVSLGETLNQDQRLISKDGAYFFTAQSDGYLIISRHGIQTIWMSPTPNVGLYNPNPFKVTLESNGNLVFKDGSNREIWSTNTEGKGAINLIMEDNGNLALYDKDGNEVWSSGTGGFDHKKIRMKAGGNAEEQEELYLSSKIDRLNAGEFFLQGGFLLSMNERYKAIMQPDGNFVVYNKGNEARSAVWATHTYSRGKAPYRLVMHASGRLVVYDGKEETLWMLKKTEREGAGQYLMLENDGTLSVYSENGRKLWSSYGLRHGDL